MATSTCWSVIEEAAAGSSAARELLARQFAPVLRAYLIARWKDSPCRTQIVPAIEETLAALVQSAPVQSLPAFEEDPAVARPGLRRHLHALAKTVARNIEVRQWGDGPGSVPTSDSAETVEVPPDDRGLAQHFERAWAQALVRAAATHMSAQAASDSTMRRPFELLQLHFGEGLAFSEIAARWQTDVTSLQADYADARSVFRAILRELVAYYLAPSSASFAEEWTLLFESLRPL